MSQADSDNTTLAWRDCLFAIAIVFMMISGGVASSLLAQSLEARLAHRCAVTQKAVLR